MLSPIWKERNINDQIARYEDNIKAYEKIIADYRTNICNLARKAIDTMNPPEPVTFDDSDIDKT